MLLAHRFEGTVPAVLIMVLAARASGPASALSAGEFARRLATAALRRQAAFASAWVLFAAAASVRAGSTVMADIAGAHGVAGLALARGPVLSIAGMWLAVLGVAIAIGGSFPARVGVRLAGPNGGMVLMPALARRLDLLGVAVQILFVAALAAGAQIRSATDAIGWVAAAVALGAWTWFGRDAARLPIAPAVAFGLCAAGLALVVGGRA